MDVAGHSETYGLIGVVWVIVPEKYALPSFDITVMMLVPLSPLKLKYIGSFVSRTVFSPCCTPLRSRRKVMGLSRTSLMANSKVSAPLHSATQRFFSSVSETGSLVYSPTNGGVTGPRGVFSLLFSRIKPPKNVFSRRPCRREFRFK